MPELLRLFIGIGAGDTWTDMLSRTAESLRREAGQSVRWVRPELYHVTVIFLGNQSPDDVPAIEAALADAAVAAVPFELHLTALHRLGGHERGALVAGVDDPTGGLQRFRATLDAALRERGIAFDARRLVPHVTLGRPRGRSGALSMPTVDLRDAPHLAVQTVELVKSELLPGGPRYETLASVALGDPTARDRSQP